MAENNGWKKWPIGDKRKGSEGLCRDTAKGDRGRDHSLMSKQGG